MPTEIRWRPIPPGGMGSWATLGPFMMLTTPVQGVKIDPATADAAPFVDEEGRELRGRLEDSTLLNKGAQPVKSRGEAVGEKRWVANVRRGEDHIALIDNAGRGWPTEALAQEAAVAYITMNGLLHK